MILGFYQHNGCSVTERSVVQASADRPAHELMGLLEGVTGIPLLQQAVIHNGKQLNPM
jgi:hypothetical protein